MLIDYTIQTIRDMQAEILFAEQDLATRKKYVRTYNHIVIVVR